MTSHCLELAGLCLGLVASIILAFSLNELLRAFALVAEAHDLMIQTSVSRAALGHGDLVLLDGADKHLDRGGKSARRRTTVGLVLLALSFACQLGAVLLPAPAPPMSPSSPAVAGPP
jgi:hypothetical protein